MIYHYYLSTHSALGMINWKDTRLQQFQKTMHTIGYPTDVMRALAGTAMQLAREEGKRLELVHHPLDGRIQGILLPEQGVAVWNTPLWMDQSHHLENLYDDPCRDEAQKQFQEALCSYAAALRVHDDWEAIYKAQTDYDKLDRMAEEMIQTLALSEKKDVKGTRMDAFFGAATPEGPVDYIANLTEGLKRRFFLKGRPGTGKSTYLKKIVDAAQNAGEDLEVYHCAFDPNSLDMVVLRAQGVCIFDSTAPHEYFPNREGDEIIDLYRKAVRTGTDERFAARLGMVAKEYKTWIKRAAVSLAKARDEIHMLEASYAENMNPAKTAFAIEELVHFLFESNMHS